MAELLFTNSGEEFTLEDNAEIAQCCEEAGVPFACTDGLCGTCIVEIDETEGKLSKPTQAEIDFLGDHGIKRERMCCQSRILHGKVKITS